MSLSAVTKKKAAESFTKTVISAENLKAEKQLSGDGQIAALEKKIAALKETGGFENTIKRFEAQIVQIKNKRRYLRK